MAKDDPEDTRTYRRNVGVVLRRADGKILMCERINKAGAWQFPQGGVKRKEERLDALWREIEEELGLVPPEQFCTVVGYGPEVTYRFRGKARERISRKYKGQAQMLYLMDYHGTDEDFDLEYDDHPEFRAFQWVTVQEAIEIIWKIKRPVFVATVEALGML